MPTPANWRMALRLLERARNFLDEEDLGGDGPVELVETIDEFLEEAEG